MRFLKIGFFFLAALLFSCGVWGKTSGGISSISFGELPPEAQRTFVLIKQGRPLPYAKDGAVFGNYEGILPRHQRGYYHEYTVKTPGTRNRGARRIIVGGTGESREYFYTEDHYVSFKRIRE